MCVARGDTRANRGILCVTDLWSDYHISGRKREEEKENGEQNTLERHWSWHHFLRPTITSSSTHFFPTRRPQPPRPPPPPTPPPPPRTPSMRRSLRIPNPPVSRRSPPSSAGARAAVRQSCWGWCGVVGGWGYSAVTGSQPATPQLPALLHGKQRSWKHHLSSLVWAASPRQRSGWQMPLLWILMKLLAGLCWRQWGQASAARARACVRARSLAWALGGLQSR